jgi:predicted DNA-binding protein with PD1-like motif
MERNRSSYTTDGLNVKHHDLTACNRLENYTRGNNKILAFRFKYLYFQLQNTVRDIKPVVKRIPEKMPFQEGKPEKHYIGRLPFQKDLITSIEEFCRNHHIETGWFSLIGAVSSVTIGYYDQKQMVYVTSKLDQHLEIASCSGNISQKEGKPFVHAHAVLTDAQGNAMGGHLFSDTIVFSAEIHILSFSGITLDREYDHQTGLMLWNLVDP